MNFECIFFLILSQIVNTLLMFMQFFFNFQKKYNKLSKT